MEEKKLIIDWEDDERWAWMELWYEGIDEDGFEELLDRLGFSWSYRKPLPFNRGEELYGRTRFNTFVSWSFFPQKGFVYGQIEGRLEDMTETLDLLGEEGFQWPKDIRGIKNEKI